MVSDSNILELRNKNDNSKIKLISSGLSTMKLKDETNSETLMNWPVPFENGIIDLLKKATVYDKWLPLVISLNASNTIYFFSFPDLQPFISCCI